MSQCTFRVHRSVQKIVVGSSRSSSEGTFNNSPKVSLLLYLLILQTSAENTFFDLISLLESQIKHALVYR